MKNWRFILIVAIILIFAFSHFFEFPENHHKSFIARQKFSGIVQKKYNDSIFKKQQVIVVNDKKNYIDDQFANELNVGDSVTKTLYELTATIYKKDGKKVEFDLLNRKINSKR